MSSSTALAFAAPTPGAALAPSPETLAGYTGRQRAAILLIALGPERAAGVLGHLGDAEVEALSGEMAALHRVDNEVAAAVVADLCAQVAADGARNQGGPEYTRAVLELLLGPERAAQLLQMLTGDREPRPFDFLRHTPAEQVVAFLADEAPQTVALVVASLEPEQGASVLAGLPAELQGAVAVRIATMRETSPGVVRDVEDGLRTKLSSVVQQEFSSAGGTDALAELLNQAGRSTERNVLEAVGGVSEELAEEVRSKLFTFDDLGTLADRDLQLVLRDVDQKDLAVALRGVQEALRERLFANMSSRGAEMLREDLEIGQPQLRAVVEAAQARIVATVRDLEGAGTIRLGRGPAAQEEEVI